MVGLVIDDLVVFIYWSGFINEVHVDDSREMEQKAVHMEQK